MVIIPYYKRSSTPRRQPNTGTVSIARPRLEGDSVNGAAAGQRDDIISHCLHRCSTLSYRATKAALHRGAAATEQRMMSSLTTCPCYGTVPTTRVLAASQFTHDPRPTTRTEERVSTLLCNAGGDLILHLHLNELVTSHYVLMAGDSNNPHRQHSSSGGS